MKRVHGLISVKYFSFVSTFCSLLFFAGFFTQMCASPDLMCRWYFRAYSSFRFKCLCWEQLRTFFLQLSCCLLNPFMLPSPDASSSSLFLLSDTLYSHISLSEESTVYIMNLISTERSSSPPPFSLAFCLDFLQSFCALSLSSLQSDSFSFRSIFISPSLHELLPLPDSLYDQCSIDRYDCV